MRTKRTYEEIEAIALQTYNHQTTRNLDVNKMKIPGLSFSWKRALGVTRVKREFTKATGIPTTKSGVERKIGSAIIKAIFKK